MRCLTTTLQERIVAPLLHALKTGTPIQAYSESAVALLALAQEVLAKPTTLTARLVELAPGSKYAALKAANSSARHPTPHLVQ